MASRALPIATVALALVLGVWLRAPALHAGFWADDYLHAAMLDGSYPVARRPWDLFRFAHGGADTARMVDAGYYPWWTHPDFRLSMLRPAASVLHALDHAAFGHDAFLHHLHSLVFWALCVAAVALLLFSLLPRPCAAAAVVLFALDESHTVPLVWLANRSLLIATACGTAALYLHVRWRLGLGGHAARAGSVALFAVALLSGEYALAMFGYLLAFELLARRGDPTRVRALLPLAGLAVLYLALWAALGYGSAHSGMYVNPLETPGAYLANALAGMPVLIGDLVLTIPADWWTFGSPLVAELRATRTLAADSWAELPDWRSVHVVLGAIAALLGVAILRWLQRRLEPAHAASLRWLGAGAVLGLLPMLGSFITTRLALPASIAFAALFGSALVQAALELRAFSVRALPRMFGAAAILLFVVAAHIGRASVFAAGSAAYFQGMAVARTHWPLTAEIDDARVADQRIVIANARDAGDAPYLPFVRHAHGHPQPRGFHLLSGSPTGHELRRVDARTIELIVLDRVGLADSVSGSLTRPRTDTLRPGQRFELPGLHVYILATNAGQPVHMRYTFDVALEDPSLLFLHATSTGLRRLQLPSVGHSLRLPAPRAPELRPSAAVESGYVDG